MPAQIDSLKLFAIPPDAFLSGSRFDAERQESQGLPRGMGPVHAPEHYASGVSSLPERI